MFKVGVREMRRSVCASQGVAVRLVESGRGFRLLDFCWFGRRGWRAVAGLRYPTPRLTGFGAGLLRARARKARSAAVCRPVRAAAPSGLAASVVVAAVAVTCLLPGSCSPSCLAAQDLQLSVA
jgi:hypothetical protein